MHILLSRIQSQGTKTVRELECEECFYQVETAAVELGVVNESSVPFF